MTPPFRRSPTHAYFQAIETVFIALRGAPLFLSSEDWQITRSWHEQGIPLRLIEQTLADIFERRRQKEGEDGKRKLVTLRFCRRLVESAWGKRQQLMAPGESSVAPAMDPRARLDRLAAALPAGLPERQHWAGRIRACEGDPALRGGSGETQEVEEVEDRLAELDSELLAAAAQSLGPELRAELEDRLRASAAALADRLPAAELERARTLLERQTVRQLAALPVLSLFSPQAEG